MEKEIKDPWSEKESNVRKEKFMKSYEELVKKYDIRLMAFPELIPSGQRGFNITASMCPIDMRHINVPSPIKADELAK